MRSLGNKSPALVDSSTDRDTLNDSEGSWWNIALLYGIALADVFSPVKSRIVTDLLIVERIPDDKLMF